MRGTLFFVVIKIVYEAKSRVVDASFQSAAAGN